MKPKYIFILGFSYLILIILAGLWPLKIFQTNQVFWLKNRKGIEINQDRLEKKFSERGISFSENPLIWPAGKTNETFAIEIWIKPLEEDVRRLGCILSIEDGQHLEVLRLEKWMKALIVQKRISGQNSYKKFGVQEIQIDGQEVLITITVARKAIYLYVDGELTKKIHNYIASPLNNSILGRLVLGTDPSGRSPWWGEIYGLALYADTLTGEEVQKNFKRWKSGNIDQVAGRSSFMALYTFSEGQGAYIRDLSANQNDILIPNYFRTLRHNFLTGWKGNYQTNRSIIQDFVINLFGFIPFGFILTALFINTRILVKKYKIYLLVTFISFMVSLGIEYLQIYIVQRSSSIVDLAVNTAGGLVGVLGYYTIKYFRKQFPQIKTEHTS